MKQLNWFTTNLNKQVLKITAVMFILMTIFVTAQVVARYVLNKSVPWSEEYSRYLFIYVVLLGSSVAVKEKGHVAVTMIADRLKGQLKYGVALFSTLISCGFFGVMIYSGYYSMLRAAIQVSPATATNLGLVYAAVPISGALMLLYSVEALLEQLRDGARGQQPTDDSALPDIE